MLINDLCKKIIVNENNNKDDKEEKIKKIRRVDMNMKIFHITTYLLKVQEVQLMKCQHDFLILI